MKLLTVTATTTDDEINDTTPYLDTRKEAFEHRSDGEMMCDDSYNLEYHEINGVNVLYSPAFGFALVNDMSPGVGDSLLLEAGECTGPEDAVSKRPWAWY